MNLKNITTLLILFWLTTSCLGPRSFTPTQNYDFGKPVQSNIKLNIGTIAQNSIFNNKMIFRLTSEKVEISEHNRWTRSPDLVLNDYLKGSFIPGGNLTLEGEILLLENDLTIDQACFSFYYKVTKNGYLSFEGLYQKTAPSSKSGEAYAKAIAQLTTELVDELKQKMNSVKE